MFLDSSMSTSGTRFQPIPRKFGFIYTAKKKVEDESYTIEKLSDADYIHCHKKLVNHSDHNARMLMMGTYHIHLNSIQQVFDMFPAAKYGLTKGDVERSCWRDEL